MHEPLHVLFHTCGNHAIGMGHVVRSLALAQALEESPESVQIRFAVQEVGEGVRQIESCGFPVRLWDEPDPLQPDVAVIDVPNPNVEFFKKLREAGVLTVSVDDPGPARYAADLAFSMLYAPAATRPLGCGTREFGGFGYFALQQGFANLPPKGIHERAYRVLVAQGGSDTYGVLPRICKVLRQMQRDLDVNVIVGPAFQHNADLQGSIGTDPRFSIRRQPASRVAIMQETDLAVSAAGITAFELAAAGVPMLLLVSEPKEVETAVSLAHEGAAVYPGHSSHVSDDSLTAAITALLDDPVRRRALSRRGQALVDGHGARRVIDAILAHTRTMWKVGEARGSGGK